MRELHCVDDVAAEVPYGLSVQAEGCKFPELETYPIVSALIRDLKHSEPSTIESLADRLSKRVNIGMRYHVNGFQDRTAPLQKIEGDSNLSLDYSEKVLSQGYGRCEDAGTVTRTILRQILPDEFKVVGLMIESQAYDGTHDISVIYSPQGKIFLDSIRFQGHEGGLFSEQTSPIEIVKLSDLF